MYNKLAAISLICFAACTQPLKYDPDTVVNKRGCKAYNFDNAPTVYDGLPYKPSADEFVFREKSTGSLFNLRGEAFSGPLANKKVKLKQLPTANMFWFAFSVYFPGASIYGRTEKNIAFKPNIAQMKGKSGCIGGKNCIPTIGTPFTEIDWVKSTSDNARYLKDSDTVMGVAFNNEAKAYPRNILWWHEIVNDQMGDVCYATTLCPLVGGALTFDGSKHLFGISGNLYNANLIMYDINSNEADDSYWPQLWMGAVDGPATGEWLSEVPFMETTWGIWKKLYPNTLVISEETGFTRDYEDYPYGDYRTDNSDTFGALNPPPSSIYPKKTYTSVLTLDASDKSKSKAYVNFDLSFIGNRVVLNDTFENRKLIFLYEGPADSNLPPSVGLAFEVPDGMEFELVY